MTTSARRSVDVLDLCVKDLRKFSAEKGDRNSGEEHPLIASTAMWAVRLAYNFCRKNGVMHLLGDLIQEASLGLIDASKKYDPEKGRFITNATNHVTRRLCEYMDNHSFNIRISTHRWRDLREYGMYFAATQSDLRRQPTDEEVVKAGFSRDKLIKIKSTKAFNQVSSNLIDENEDLFNFVPDDSVDFVRDFIELDFQMKLGAVILECLSDFATAREYEAVVRYFGLNGEEPESLQCIADRLGMKQTSQVRKLIMDLINRPTFKQHLKEAIDSIS